MSRQCRQYGRLPCFVRRQCILARLRRCLNRPGVCCSSSVVAATGIRQLAVSGAAERLAIAIKVGDR